MQKVTTIVTTWVLTSCGFFVDQWFIAPIKIPPAPPIKVFELVIRKP